MFSGKVRKANRKGAMNRKELATAISVAMNRKELATATSVDMDGGAWGRELEVKYIERVLASMANVIASTMRNKEKVTIDNLCSFHPFTGKTRVINTLYGKRVIPERERVRVDWSRNFMDNIKELS